MSGRRDDLDSVSDDEAAELRAASEAYGYDQNPPDESEAIAPPVAPLEEQVYTTTLDKLKQQISELERICREEKITVPNSFLPHAKKLVSEIETLNKLPKNRKQDNINVYASALGAMHNACEKLVTIYSNKEESDDPNPVNVDPEVIRICAGQLTLAANALVRLDLPNGRKQAAQAGSHSSAAKCLLVVAGLCVAASLAMVCSALFITSTLPLAAIALGLAVLAGILTLISHCCSKRGDAQPAPQPTNNLPSAEIHPEPQDAGASAAPEAKGKVKKRMTFMWTPPHRAAAKSLVNAAKKYEDTAQKFGKRKVA